MRRSLALAKCLRPVRRVLPIARAEAGTFVAFSAFMPIRRILAATDFSTGSRAALRHAAALARARQAELVLVHVFDPVRYQLEIGGVAGTKVVEEKNELRRLLESARCELGPVLDVSSMFLEGAPHTQIAEAARFLGVDVVFVGSHGCTGLDRAPSDNAAENVVTESLVPIVVGRGSSDGGFRRILVGIDFFELAGHALAAALDVAEPPARIDLLHVLQVPVVDGKPVLFDPSTLRALEEKARNHGADLLAQSARPGLELHFELAIGTPKEAILAASRAGHDLVALGPHAALGIRRLPYGSLGQTVIREAPCSVLIA